jgi:hypothetical protein
MRIVIRPAARRADKTKSIFDKPKAISRIGIRNMSVRIVTTPGRVAAVFKEIDIVPQPGEPHHILKVVPHKPAERTPNDIPEHDDSNAR